MRRTITISVSDEMHSLIYDGMHSHFYSTVSEYIRFLVRRDQRPESVKKQEFADRPPRTANQFIEDAKREIDAEQASFETK